MSKQTAKVAEPRKKKNISAAEIKKIAKHIARSHFNLPPDKRVLRIPTPGQIRALADMLEYYLKDERRAINREAKQKGGSHE